MDGIHILNQTEIMTSPSILNKLAIIITIVFLLSLIFLAISSEYDWESVGLYSLSTVIISSICLGICLITFIFVDDTVHTGRYRYEVTLDKSVSFEDVMEKYDVIEQRGEIWVLEDKEE